MSLANKAIEVYLQYLDGEFSSENRLVSEIGSDKQFGKEGFIYSVRYYNCLKNSDLLNVSLRTNISCPECNGEYKVDICKSE